jgi:hypothetical protein
MSFNVTDYIVILSISSASSGSKGVISYTENKTKSTFDIKTEYCVYNATRPRPTYIAIGT